MIGSKIKKKNDDVVLVYHFVMCGRNVKFLTASSNSNKILGLLIVAFENL